MSVISNQEILEKAIQKAIDGGWKHPYNGISDFGWTVHDYQKLKVSFYSIAGGSDWDVEKLIFNHDFAKALWGEETVTRDDKSFRADFLQRIWQYHLQQMVISEDPIKYLGENI